jgi:hypothetical protein
VAGPYTLGDVEANVRRAMDAGDELLDAGFAPLIPHFSHFLHLRKPRAWGVWMEMDLAWLVTSEGVLRLPGESRGADREVEVARQNSIPVFMTIEQLRDHFRGRLEAKDVTR